MKNAGILAETIPTNDSHYGGSSRLRSDSPIRLTCFEPYFSTVSAKKTLAAHTGVKPHQFERRSNNIPQHHSFAVECVHFTLECTHLRVQAFQLCSERGVLFKDGAMLAGKFVCSQQIVEIFRNHALAKAPQPLCHEPAERTKIGRRIRKGSGRCDNIPVYGFNTIEMG